MVFRIFAIIVFASTILASGCCATGANDLEFTRTQTQLNLPR